jgi:hypothetical protein
MDSLTDGRRFVDVGDDNADGRIEENGVDLSQNEKLINNVDYYYQVLAFDAGSDEGTPAKSNSGIAGLNEVRATPEAPSAGPTVNPKVISSEGLGGIHNFRFNTLDNQRLGQLFGGDTLEFEFQPARPTEFLADSLQAAGNFLAEYFYTHKVIVRSVKRNKELMRFALQLGEFTDRADSAIRLLDSGFWSRWVGGQKFIARNVRVPYNLSYNADPLRPVYNTVGIYKNTFSVGFDYSVIQFGDTLRPGVFGDTTFRQSPFTLQSSQGTNANMAAERLLFVGQQLNIARSPVLQGLPSIGQPKLEITFEPGGTERVSATKNNRTYSFDANYLTLKVRNIASFKRQVYDASGNVTDEEVTYNYEFPEDPDAKIKADTTSIATRIERVIDRGEFALYAFGWLDPDDLDDAGKKNQFARSRQLIGLPNDSKAYIGTPNRYYTGAYTVDTTTIKFTHKLVVNGAALYLDYAGMGSTASQVDPAAIPNPSPTSDFKAGDKVIVEFTGGALGLPQPGGKVRVAIPNVAPKLEEYSDDLLDQVAIVPNPYLVNHIGQVSTTDRRLYFTRLPAKCTIQLYTESGELLQTLEHDATVAGGESGREAVEVWDLLTKSNRQAQSQLIIARITTPNGAETVKKVAIVVGGFRLNNR